MAYRTRRSTRSAGRSRYSSRSRPRARRRTSRRRSAGTQRIVIQVMGPSGGQVPVLGSSGNLKGVRPVRRMF